MGKLLDLFMLVMLCSITAFILLWSLVCIIEGAVCLGCVLSAFVVFLIRRVLIPLFNGENGGLV